jgi:hypothetical protein
MPGGQIRDLVSIVCGSGVRVAVTVAVSRPPAPGWRAWPELEIVVDPRGFEPLTF